VDGILKLVFAKELTGGVPESATKSARASWNGARDMSCASFEVSYMSVRALDVEQMTWVAELVAGNIDVQAHTSVEGACRGMNV
jgi:hypothetical protein